jgi:DNA-binding NarL/FixJ family response regulator
VSIMDRDGEAVPPDERDGDQIDLVMLRRLSVVALMARGYTAKEIARYHRVSVRTVWYDIQRVNPEAGRRVMQAG